MLETLKNAWKIADLRQKILYTLLIVGFGFFYSMIQFNPVEVANNLKKNGGFVMGYRPGKPTSDYIRKILNRITFIGAVFLCVVSEVPKMFVAIFQTLVEVNTVVGGNAVLDAIQNFYSQGANSFATLAFAGTSVLIVVGVILETVRELESQLTMRNYKGFLN